jgi:hypothetical protein
MRKIRFALIAGMTAVAVGLASLFAYRIGFSGGAEAGLATGVEVAQVGHGAAALSIIRHLDAGRDSDARAELDAQVDAGISAHWLRTQAPSHYADVVESPAELVGHLEEYRRSRPSTAYDQTPTMNRFVAEYLSEQNEK